MSAVACFWSMLGMRKRYVVVEHAERDVLIQGLLFGFKQGWESRLWLANRAFLKAHLRSAQFLPGVNDCYSCTVDLEQSYLRAKLGIFTVAAHRTSQ